MMMTLLFAGSTLTRNAGAADDEPDNRFVFHNGRVLKGICGWAA